MKTKYFFVVMLLVLLALTAATSVSAAPTHEVQTDGLIFIENVGQFDPEVRFQVLGDRNTLWVTNDAIWVTVTDPQNDDVDIERGVAVKLSFTGATPQVVEPFELLDTRFAYFMGNDPSQWHTDVPVWGGARFTDLYPGIDLELSGKNGELQQRVIVRDATHIADVNLSVEGADFVTEAEGLTLIGTPLGTLATPRLVIQDSSNDAVVMPPIDPEVFDLRLVPMHTGTLTWSTYLGGTKTDMVWDVDDDNYGNTYVCGSTMSSTFPKKAGSFDVVLGGTEDAFLAKYNAKGKLLYNSFLGGSGTDFCRALYVKANGPVYLTGGAWSTDFPTTFNAYDRTLNGGRDVFVAVMVPTTDLVPVYQLLYSTYLGGDNWEYGFAIEADDAANAFVCGYTHGGFPTKNAAQAAYGGGTGDAFVASLNTSPMRPAGNDGLNWSTYLGGSGNEHCDGIEEQSGYIYAVGGTDSPGTSFPTTAGVYDRNCVNCVANTAGDPYIVKYNAATGARLLSTLVGKDQAKVEVFTDVEADSTGKVFTVGFTYDTTFPTTANAYDKTHNGNRDAMVVVLNSNFASLAYSSYFGGSGDDFALDMDHNGNHIYFAGGTNSTNLPMVSATQATNKGGFDAFIAWFDTSLSGVGGLVYSTYLGGTGNDNVYYEGVDNYWGIGGLERGDDGSLYLGGTTSSTNFPTKLPAQSTNKGNTDGFVTKLMVVP